MAQTAWTCEENNGRRVKSAGFGGFLHRNLEISGVSSRPRSLCPPSKPPSWLAAGACSRPQGTSGNGHTPRRCGSPGSAKTASKCLERGWRAARKGRLREPNRSKNDGEAALKTRLWLPEPCTWLAGAGAMQDRAQGRQAQRGPAIETAFQVSPLAYPTRISQE